MGLLRPFLLVLVAALPLYSQAPTGEIRIVVKDSSGAAVGASGQLQSVPAGTDRKFKTDSQGWYTFTALPFHQYRLEVVKSGFAPQSLSVEIQSATPLQKT